MGLVFCGAGCNLFRPDPVPEPNEVGVTINGVVWATRNVGSVGTFVAYPESAGMFYQWNRKVAWPSTGPVTGWNETNASGYDWTTGNDPCPPGWRMPTKAEFEKLVASGSVWTTVGGINGRRFGSGANTIFLPALGRRGYTGAHIEDGTDGNYWCSNPADDSFASGFGFNSLFGNSFASYGKSQGLSCRCVRK